jgi:hypothetical protein
MGKTHTSLLYPLDMETIALRLESGESTRDVAASLPLSVHWKSLQRRYRQYRGYGLPRTYPLSDAQIIAALHDADAAIPYSVIAAQYGVSVSTIKRLHKNGTPSGTRRHVPQPSRPAPSKALENYERRRSGLLTRERNNRRKLRERLPVGEREREAASNGKDAFVTNPVPAMAMSEPIPDTQETQPLPPLPRKLLWKAPLGALEPPQRTTITLGESEARHVVKDLQDLGWRAEHVSMTSGCALIEVRDFSQKHMPLVATLRTMRDVLRFEGINLPCPRRGAPLPADIKLGAVPFRKNHRAKDTPAHFPPQASLGTGLGRITGDIDY